MLFWTDNYSEPKKINIDRCKAGTNINGVANNFTRSTKLFIEDPISGDYIDANTVDFELDYGGSTLSDGSGIDSYLKEKHITVIRPAPKTPPTLIMKNGVREKTSTVVEYNFITDDGLNGNVEVGTYYSINYSGLYNTNFKKNDILQLSSTYVAINDSDLGDDTLSNTQSSYLTAKFISYQTEQGETLVDTLNTTSYNKDNNFKRRGC